MRRTVRTAITIAAVGLAGCGRTTEPGGPLRVESVTPTALAVDVPITDTVIVVFSKPVQPSSVSDSTIVLSRNGLRVLGTTALAADSRTVTISARLGNNGFYVLEIRTGVTDAGGNALAAAYVSAFSTAVATDVSVQDPKNDTYNGSAIPDVTSLSASPSADAVTIRLQFSASVSPSTSGLANAMGGIIDLDVDQDPTTGLEALTDAFGPPGTSTGLGVEYYVLLFLDQQGNARVVDIGTGLTTGTVPVSFGDSSVTVRVPLTMLGRDDGNMNMAAVVGTLSAPSDLVPNVGHLTLGTGGQVGTSRSAPALRAVPAVRAPPIGVWGR